MPDDATEGVAKQSSQPLCSAVLLLMYYLKGMKAQVSSLQWMESLIECWHLLGLAHFLDLTSPLVAPFFTASSLTFPPSLFEPFLIPACGY